MYDGLLDMYAGTERALELYALSGHRDPVSVSERHTPIHLLAAHGCSKQHSLIEQLIDVWKESSFVIGVGQVS